MSCKVVVVNAAKMDFDGKLDFSVLSDDVQVFADSSEEELLQRIQGADVVVTKEDIQEIPGDTVKIRLPGKEWSETLTLEDVGPGTYLIEAMDADGNVRTVEVRVTMRDIFARSIRSARAYPPSGLPGKTRTSEPTT